MKKIAAILAALVIASSVAVTAFAVNNDPLSTITSSPMATLYSKTSFTVHTSGEGEIAATTDGSEPIFDDDNPVQSKTFDAEKGISVKLKAKAKEGSKFLYWLNATTSEIYSFNPNESFIVDGSLENVELIAIFDVESDKSLVAAKVYGKGQVAGSDDGTDPVFDNNNRMLYSAFTVDKDKKVKFTAKPDDGYVFVFWANEETKEFVSFEDTVTVDADKNMHLVAVYDADVERYMMSINTEG